MLNPHHDGDWHIGRPTLAYPAEFVAFAGQSNMVGFNMDAASLASVGWKTDPLTFVWNNQTSHFEVMNPTVNTNAFSWGPAVGFAMQFRAEHPFTPLYIVQTAMGQTSLEQNLNGFDDWSPQSHGQMFDKMTARLDLASAALGRHPDAVFIDQGETDGEDASASAAYQHNFEAFLAAVRAQWLHDPGGYVGWARIPDSVPYWQQIDTAQTMVEAETGHADSFDTLDVSRQPDHIHYDAAGLILVGHRFEDLFEAHAF